MPQMNKSKPEDVNMQHDHKLFKNTNSGLPICTVLAIP